MAVYRGEKDWSRAEKKLMKIRNLLGESHEIADDEAEKEVDSDPHSAEAQVFTEASKVLGQAYYDIQDLLNEYSNAQEE